MQLVLAFGVLLAVGALVSARAHRSVLSTTVLFLLGGVVIGPTGTGWIRVDPEGSLLFTMAEVALFVVLFTDAMRLPLRELSGSWRLGGRALLIGMPLTIALMLVAAHLLLGLPWLDALLVAAALAPTDPVLAEAIIGGAHIPVDVTRTLNIESGLNDGLALPVVLITLAALSSSGPSWGSVVASMAGGVLSGVVVALSVLGLERLPFLGSARRYEPLLLIAIGVIVFAGDQLLGANAFLGAFAAGVTAATVSEDLTRSFEALGSTVTEVLKLFAVFLLGLVLSREFFHSIDAGLAVFVVFALVIARPAAIYLGLLRTRVPRPQRSAIAWFGPKGFASVTFSLIILRAGIPDARTLVVITTFVIVASMVAHSSTDVLVARRVTERPREEPVPRPAPTAS